MFERKPAEDHLDQPTKKAKKVPKQRDLIDVIEEMEDESESGESDRKSQNSEEEVNEDHEYYTKMYKGVIKNKGKGTDAELEEEESGILLEIAKAE